MSEQWWAVKRDGVFLLVEPTRRHADQELVSHYPAPEQYSVVPVRIVEDAEPCPWELMQAPDAAQEGKQLEPSTNLMRLVRGWHHFCPNCGRSLKEE